MARVYGIKSVEEALQHLLKVADCNPNDPFVYHAIGLQFHAIKCYKEALKYFLKAEQIKSGISSSNLFYIGDCLRRNGENDEAINYYKKSLCIPARNRVDYKGMCEARKALISLGFPSDEIDKLTVPQNKTQSSI